MIARPSICVFTLLAVLLGAPAAIAQEGTYRPGDWTVAGGIPEAAIGAPQPALWLPMGPAREGPGPPGTQGVPLGDALGRHAAVFFAPAPRCVVGIDFLVTNLRAAPLLDWSRATLTPHDGSPVGVQVGDAWNGQPAGRQEVADDRGGGLVMYRIPFPPLDPSWGDVTLSVPVEDDMPLFIRFRRWRDVVAEAEADLAAWKAHIVASRMASAIEPYLDDDGYRRFVSRDEQVVAALLLAELRRGEERRDPGAVPRFLVLHVLAGTAWGRTQGVPDHGDERAAARVLARWRDVGYPAVPGAAPFEADRDR